MGRGEGKALPNKQSSNKIYFTISIVKSVCTLQCHFLLGAAPSIFSIKVTFPNVIIYDSAIYTTAQRA